MGILSNSAITNQYAQAMMDGANAIVDCGDITPDGNSIIEGNSQGQTHITSESSISGRLSLQVKQFMTNLNSVAGGFEAVDQTIANDIGLSASQFEAPKVSPNTNSDLFGGK